MNALGAALVEESWMAVAVVDRLDLEPGMRDLLASSRILQELLPVMLSMASSSIARFRKARRWVARELTVA